MRKVTRGEFAATVSLIKVAPGCGPGQKVGNYRTCRARGPTASFAVSTRPSIPFCEERNNLANVTRSRYQASPFLNRITLDVCFEVCPWYIDWVRDEKERDSARKESPTTPRVPTRRAGVTHYRGRDAQRSTFHSYLPCDASLRPVESTRTFVNAFACGARRCTATRTIMCMSVYRMVLTKRRLLWDDLLDFGRITWLFLVVLHVVVVIYCIPSQRLE